MGLASKTKLGAPILAAFLFLRLGWDLPLHPREV